MKVSALDRTQISPVPTSDQPAESTLDRDLSRASEPRRWACPPTQVGAELDRLERLLQFARRSPGRWQEVIAGRELALALWVYGLALAVASWGCGHAAEAMLDILPGIEAGGGGRRELLTELIVACADEQGLASAA